MKKNILFLLLLIVGCVLSFPAKAQSDAVKETFDDAEYFFAMEDYNEALVSYLRLLKRGFQDNANVNYKLGICYLYTTTEKSKAVECLEKAVAKVSESYNEGSIKEDNAPYDAYLFLGNAYRVNMQLDKAVEAYSKYIEIENRKGYEVNKNWANLEIEACKRAKSVIQNPAKVKVELFSKPINTKEANYNPIVTPDENLIVYVTKQKFYDALFVSKLNKGKWSSPENVNDQVESDGDQYPTFISADGKTLLLAKQDNDNSDIFLSKYEKNEWTPSKPLNKEVNTKYWESHATMSPDGRTLYFTSNREGGKGGLDIYTAQRGAKGEWENIQNIGEKINTPFNEETPCISPDGKRLYFSSQGHNSIGGYDIFYSEKDARGNWSEPLSLRYPVNTTDDDLFFVPSKNNYLGYQAKYIKGLTGDLDVVKIEIFSKEHPFNYNILGKLSDYYPVNNDDGIVVNLISNDKVVDSVSNISKGQFSLSGISGTYRIALKIRDQYINSDLFTIPDDYLLDNFILSDSVLKLKEKVIAYVATLPKAEAPNVKEDKAAGDAQKKKEGDQSAAVIRNILFSFDDFRLTPEAEKEINNLIQVMQTNPTLVIEITGYTDSQGKARYNRKLSESRAESIKELIVKAGVEAKRIKTKGKGASDPIAINTLEDGSDCPEGRDFNRRAEFRIVKCENKNITIEPIKVPEKYKLK